MFKNRRLSTVAAIVLALTACSDGGSDHAPDTAASTAAPAGESPPPAPTPPPESPPAPPGPPSAPPAETQKDIAGVTFDKSSHQRHAHGSDNWPVTWSDDDQQYGMFGDGGGFDGDNGTGRASFGVARIEGAHDDYRGVNRHGGRNGECRSKMHAKSHGAPISIGGVLYAWVTPRSNAAGYEKFTLHRSVDKGCSWTKLDVQFSLARDGVSFGSFAQAGRDNASAPDQYVYTIAAEIRDARSLSIVQRPGRIMLVRAPAAAIENRSSYEFYAGVDSAGEPQWSTDAEDRKPVYEDADGVGPFPQLSFVPGVERWVYTNEHGDGVDVKSRNSLLTMAEAPSPWGPWTIVYRDVFFPEIEQSVFQWNFAPKWFREDGRRFTLIFSGDGGNDSWNTIDGAFIVTP